MVRGQFVGYRDESGVERTSPVPTYAALRLYVDSWRWEGVPYYVRAGKSLNMTATEVVVELRLPYARRVLQGRGAQRREQTRPRPPHVKRVVLPPPCWFPGDSARKCL
jgi:glucose-6-phosphate 1-dehydrogenase